jgi:glycosyltransferase involved in cell wall biosynthesis
MNQADIFVLPSLVEGHPKVLIEAMSCGMPCAVSNCEGNRAVVGHDKTGLLFDPADVTDMAAQLEGVIGNENLARDLGRAARRQICAEFDLRRLLERETALLQAVGEARIDVISRGRSRPR